VSAPKHKAESAADLKSLPLSKVEAKLASSPQGLARAEAEKRLVQYGPNEIPEKTESPLIKFLGYFWGPIPWMIEAAAVLSAIVQHWTDLIIILVLLLANAVVGFWEEYQAGNEIAALKKRLALRARVLRDGKWSSIEARALVPGDVVRLRLGDIVPADARLLGKDPVEVDQSALTGESLPVTRSTGEALFSGSILRQGETDALVYATGARTYFGKTAQLVEEAHTISHFQRAVLKIGDYLIVIGLLAAREAIVSRLASIEELAGVDVLCSDKTGTLTQNKLRLGDPFCVDNVTRDELITAGALASRAEDQDTIDMAVLAGLKDQTQLQRYQVLHFQPFDPVHKRTEAKVKAKNGSVFRVTKGAPQVILGLSGNAAKVKPEVEKTVEEFAKRGFRSLGVARANGDGAWQFLGVLPLSDPPRQDSKQTIATARQLGIDVKMLTGDQIAIAKEIAKQIGLGTNILDASGFGDTKHHQGAQLDQSIEEADGFAQVFPEHKFHIVDVLQRHGHIVGMTGDGVNDAPPLKKADCGIAVSGATDAARAAADIVLLTPGLSVIIDAVKESRKIFQRMNSYAIYRIAETVRVLLFMTLSILVFNFYPVTAVMIVLLAVLNDGAILSIAYDNVRTSETPEAWNMRVVLGIATILGITGVVASFGLFYIGERVFHLDRAMIQTLMYLKLSVAGHLNIFVTRTRGPFWSIRPANILLLAVLGTQALATVISVYGLLMPPIGWNWAAFVWGYALVWFLVNDRVKLVAYRILDSSELPILLKRARRLVTSAA
jgi:H+-transporting ATPase